ncbi:hypothetical protein AMS68_000683 [Peltaster fructicola]|uniref:CSN8/PSMD8/EIF3K domain-containing protein n=1 Tax=Peltaster fructicola TaxID=286661 RepID=A0A6H0XKD7_9PEZI|nr:hypothetical protein AMS68_000683 [Peltaster fructicola]
MDRSVHSRGRDRSAQYKADSSNRPQPRRGPSGAWTRLKPVIIDPLDTYGLPSKGEQKLHDYANQEAYYTVIVERYMKFCASTEGGEQLEDAFASLSLSVQQGQTQRPAVQHRASATDRPNDLPNIQMAMRKLREGILGSRRRDKFAQRAYIFIIHASILTRQWESYQPALLHLLYRIHPHTSLSPSELQEFVGYHILDLACRQNDIMEAIAVKQHFHHKAVRTSRVLSSLIHDDWLKFWRVRSAVDGYQRALMQFADARVRMHALKCIGRSYLSVDRAYIERCTDLEWAGLVKEGVGWQLQENGIVIVRKPKAK